jgi:AcrR family transcriptional regulator
MLTEAIGVNVASLYGAFGNKESLFVQCVERYSELNGELYHGSLKKKTAHAGVLTRRPPADERRALPVLSLSLTGMFR